MEDRIFRMNPCSTGEPRAARAQGESTCFSLLVDECKAAPDVMRKRLWLETLQGVMTENRKIVGGDSRQLIYVPMGGGGSQAASAPLLTPDVLSPAITTPDSANDTRPSRTPRPSREEDQR